MKAASFTDVLENFNRQEIPEVKRNAGKVQDGIRIKMEERRMGESLIGGIILSCVQSFIYDISTGACKGMVKKYKQKKFLNEVEKKIKDFCLRNESIYIDSDTFRNFIKYHKPFDKVMQNALSMNKSISIEQLTNSIVTEAEEVAKANNLVLSVDDRRTLKDLLTLISDEITRYFQNILDDDQKYIVSSNVQNTKIIQRDIYNAIEGQNQNFTSLEKYMREVTSISAYKAEPIAELICKKMWLGEFDEVEAICQLVSEKSSDLELAIKVLKSEMFENRIKIEDIETSISNIDNIRIRNMVIRNIIPLLYFRKEKFDGLGRYTDSEYLKAIMTALSNEDYSYLFSMETKIEKGIEIHKYTLNKAVVDAEKWLVNQVFAIFMYNMKLVNAATLIENTIDPKTSWFSVLITYEKKVDMFVYEGLNDLTKKKMSDLEEVLEKKKYIFNRLSDDIEAVFYAMIVRILLICGKKEDDIIESVPIKLHGVRPVKDYLLALRIERGNISFEEVNDFCESVGEYWLLTNYIITLREDTKKLISLIEHHKKLLDKSETIFFVYVEALAHLDRNEDAKKYLLEYREVYRKYFEFWNVYLNVDNSIKEEFIGLCKENKIVYMTGHSGCILVERLIKFEEYELAEFYNNQLEVQQTNFKLSRKFKAYILNGKNKKIDALECFKLVYDDFPNDKSVINAILSISINLKRKIEVKYIRAAEELNDSQLLVLAGGAYATNGDFSAARRCNLKALFMSDDCRNPAFNQYLGLNLQDKQDSIPTVTSVEKNTTVVLRNGNDEVTYCIHGDRELPESPCIWHGDTHLYISDAAKLGIYRRHIGDEVILDGLNYTVESIEPIEAYVYRICFESIVKNGSAKAITTPAKDGHIDAESFINQMKEFIPDSTERSDWIQQYNNFEDVALPLYMMKKQYNATYTQFVELIIEESKSCIREAINNNMPVNDKYVLSFTSMILLKMVGLSNEYLAGHNVYVAESAVIQISEDTSEMIAHYANDSVSSMGFYEGKPYRIDTDENTKDRWIKESGELRDFVEGIPSIVCKKDWDNSMFDQFNVAELLGMPDYDAISIGVNDGYTVIGTESMITALALDNEINADVISVTNWLISTNIDAISLMDIVKKLVGKGCIYSLTEQMVSYILKAVEISQDEARLEILTAWDSLFEVYDSLDNAYRAYGIEALRSVYVSVYERIDKERLNSVMQIFSQRLLWLFKLKVTTRINEKGELEIMYYQLQDDKIHYRCPDSIEFL